MKNINNQNAFVPVIIILLMSLIINIFGIIMHLKKEMNYNYSSFQSTFEIDSKSKNVFVYSTLKKSDLAFKEGLGPREINLNYGKNIIDLAIESKNKTSKTYTLIVNKEDDRSQENRLSSLSVSNAKINFNQDQDSYNATIGCDINKISVNATLKDDSSYFLNGFEPREVNLSEGLNVIFIKVKSQAGNERQYKINIFKNTSAANCIKSESNEELESLSLNKGKINFNADKKEYSVNVDSLVDDIKVYAFAKDNNATVQIDKPDTLIYGKNTILVKVVSSQQVVNEYKINVNKRKPKVNNQELKLSKLEVSGYNIHFKPDKYNYEVAANYNKNLIISAYPYSEQSNITIQEMSQSSRVKTIKVIIESNNKKKIYSIKVRKQLWNMTNEVFAVALTFIVGLGIMALIKSYEIKKQKLKSKKKIYSKQKTVKKNIKNK